MISDFWTGGHSQCTHDQRGRVRVIYRGCEQKPPL